MDKLITIKISRCTLILKEAELLRLLAKDTELWLQAIKRGKGQIRAASTRERVAKKIQEEKRKG